MATFCRDCSLEMFGKDFGELAFAGDPDDFRSDLCEGCGWIWVNRDGVRLPTPPEDESVYPISLDPETLQWVSSTGEVLSTHEQFIRDQLENSGRLEPWMTGYRLGQQPVNNDLHSTAQSTDVEVTETP